MSDVKTCFKCDRRLPRDEFYPHPRMRDGHLNKCRECTRRDVQLHRERNREKVVAYDQVRYRAGRRPRPRSPEKQGAQSAVGNAIRRGKLVKPGVCSMCGFLASSPRQIHAHHQNYSSPLAVVWVCHPCHGKLHRMEQGQIPF